MNFWSLAGGYDREAVLSSFFPEVDFSVRPASSRKSVKTPETVENPDFQATQRHGAPRKKRCQKRLKIRWWRHRVGSSPTTGTKMNDPTQFEQVDETCEFGGAVLYSESLDMTAFLGIDAPRKI